MRQQSFVLISSVLLFINNSKLALLIYHPCQLCHKPHSHSFLLRQTVSLSRTHAHMLTQRAKFLFSTFLSKVFCWVLQYEYNFKNPIRREWWGRTHNSQSNKIPRHMSSEVKYFVKITMDLKMLRHNTRAY